MSIVRLLKIILGPLAFALALWLVPDESMGSEAKSMLATTLWVAIWWMTEAIPLPATSLLPLILLPVTGVMEIQSAAYSFGNPILLLFLGGFILAAAMKKWNLHKRIAINIITRIGFKPKHVILGFMVSTAFLSMWISNTATTLMMLPIATAIILSLTARNAPEKIGNFGKALMIGIAYSASIGGVATLIGTPPNAVLAGVVFDLYGEDLSFARWLLFAAPLSIVLLLICWWYLTRFVLRSDSSDLDGKEIISQEREKLGKMSWEEKWVLVIFIMTAVAWLLRPFVLEKIIPGINDTSIVIGTVLLLFLIPSKSSKGEMLLTWKTAREIPWGILILFGGGLVIANGFQVSHLSTWIGNQFVSFEGWHTLVILLGIALIVVFLTEINSNTATATIFFPVLAGMSGVLGIHPYVLMFVAGISASCAFMLPVATPPNAIVFGSGYLKISDMAKAGLWMNLIAIVVIAIYCYFMLPLFWNV